MNERRESTRQPMRDIRSLNYTHTHTHAPKYYVVFLAVDLDPCNYSFFFLPIWNETKTDYIYIYRLIFFLSFIGCIIENILFCGTVVKEPFCLLLHSEHFHIFFAVPKISRKKVSKKICGTDVI